MEEKKDLSIKKLEDYQILITKKTGGGGTEKILLPFNQPESSFGEIVKQKHGLDAHDLSDTISAESKLINNIDIPSSAFDLNLLAGELKEMTPDERNVYSKFIGAQGISNPVQMLNIAANIPEIMAYGTSLNVLDLVKDTPIPDLHKTFEDLKHVDFDHYRQFYSEENKKAINGEINEQTIALYLFMNFDFVNHSREEVHQILAPAVSLQPDNLWTFKKAQEQVEGDYDNIDGVIGNNDVRINSSDNRTLEEIVEGSSSDHDGEIESYPYSLSSLEDNQEAVASVPYTPLPPQEREEEEEHERTRFPNGSNT